jgi:hypothetical protein
MDQQYRVHVEEGLTSLIFAHFTVSQIRYGLHASYNPEAYRALDYAVGAIQHAYNVLKKKHEELEETNPPVSLGMGENEYERVLISSYRSFIQENYTSQNGDYVPPLSPTLLQAFAHWLRRKAHEST